jgi:hypothetical protein
MTEQTKRINENLNSYYENPDEYSFEDFADIFEDADPTDFI